MSEVKDHLSISQANKYSMCELMYFYSYIEKIKTPKHANLFIGSAFHKGLETIYKLKRDEQELNKDLVFNIAEENIQYQIELNEKEMEEAEYTEINNTAYDLIGAYLNSGIPQSIHSEEIEGIEQKLTLDLGEFEVVGYADLVLRNMVIDHKTRKRKMKNMSRQELFQLNFYAQNLGKRLISVHQAIKGSKGCSAFAIDPEESVYLDYSKLFKLLYRQINRSKKSGDFMPTGIAHTFACDFCDYNKICKYYLRNQ